MAARGRGVRLWLLIAVVVVAGFARAADSAPAQDAAKGKAAVAASDAKADAAPAPKSAIAVERKPTGTLTVFNRPIVTFRSTLLGVSPQDRAESALKRILALLERGGEAKVTVEHIDVGSVLKIDGGASDVSLARRYLEIGRHFELRSGDRHRSRNRIDHLKSVQCSNRAAIIDIVSV